MKTVYPPQTKYAGGITNKVCGGYNKVCGGYKHMFKLMVKKLITILGFEKSLSGSMSTEYSGEIACAWLS